MKNQKGVINLILPLVLLLIIGVGVFFLFYLGIIKVPSLPFLSFLQKKPSVAIKEEYKNPFKKETQFINPFQQYKNPFALAK